MREEMEGHYTGGFRKFTADVMKYVDRWFKHPSLGMEITFEVSRLKANYGTVQIKKMLPSNDISISFGHRYCQK